MPRLKPYSYEQLLMIAVDLKNQLQPGTFEFALNQVVDGMDLSIFDGRFRNDETGAPAYDPAILLKIVLFAYSRGVISSREIERACRENVVFMALSADSRPHFTTIAEFISSMEDEITPLFRNVLMVCAEEGLIGRQMFAIDGCKISSNCAKEWSGTRADFERKKGKLICPSGKELDLKNRNFGERKGYSAISYMGKKTDCRVCELRVKCLRKPHTVARQVTVFKGRADDAPKSYTQRMIERFDTAVGRFLYSRRLGIAEPVFVNICHIRGLDRFTL